MSLFLSRLFSDLDVSGGGGGGLAAGKNQWKVCYAVRSVRTVF